MDRVEEPAFGREEEIFLFSRGSDPIPCSDDGHWRVEMVEGHLLDVGRQGVQVASSLAGIGGEQDSAGLAHRIEHQAVIEGNQAASIDDLGGQAVVGLEPLRRLHSLVEGGSDGEDRQVVTIALDVGLTDGDLVILLGNLLAELLGLAVDALALEEDDRIVAAEGRGHESLGIVGGDREADLEPRDMRDQGAPVLRVLGAVLAADRDPYDHRHLDLAPGHALPLGELVEDLVPGAAEEVAIHELYQRPAALHAVANCGSGDGCLGDR